MQVTFNVQSRRMSKLLPLLLICLLISTARGTSSAQTSHPPSAGPQSDAQKAFEKLKSLKGSWQGTIANLSTQLTVRVTSGGNAIMHDAFMASISKITMMYVEGDRLFLTHYGGEPNRPRMEGKLLADGNRIEFSLLDVAGDTHRGFVKSMIFTFTDANKHTLEGTYILPDGKAIEVRGEFQRTVTEK